MSNSSILSCFRIRAHAVPGRTDDFIDALQGFVQLLPQLPEIYSYAELHVSIDAGEFDFFFSDVESPAIDTGLIASAKEIELSMNLCCEGSTLPDAQARLFSLLSDGALADCVRFCALVSDDAHAELTLSGKLGETFHHGPVPFADGCGDIPSELCWNSCTHSARFTFPEVALDDAWDLSELIPEQIDEIDLEFSFDRSEMLIHSVQLPDMAAVENYRGILQKLTEMANSASIEGVLTPESDSAFALLRFVCNDGVQIQTAVAEI